MSLKFYIPKPLEKVNERTFIKGFGLPLVQRAVIAGKVGAQESDKKEAISIFGTPVYGTVFIKQPEYQVFDFNPDTKEYVERTVGPDLGENTQRGLILENCIIDVNQTKNIITTVVVDYPGTVKEYIADGDFAITIRGFVSTTAPDLYPIDDVKTLENYLKAPVALSIVSDFLNNVFGIDTVVVQNYNLSQQQGLRNVQYFQLNCLSDNPFVILETAPDV